MEGERTFLSPILRPVERADLSRCGDRRDRRAGLEGLRGRRSSLMAFVAIVAGYVVLRLQDVLPLNPGGSPAHDPGPRVQHVGQLRDEHELAELLGRDRRELPDPGGHARASATSPRPRPAWRSRSRCSAASTRRSSKTIGNYWVDLTRGVLYILLPISVVGALVLVWQGVPQTLERPADRHDPRRARQQTIALGPIASQEIDQGARQQRRRVPQRQLRPSVREPDAADELARDVRDARRCPFALTYTFGRYAGQPAPGLDDLRGDGR